MKTQNNETCANCGHEHTKQGLIGSPMIPMIYTSFCDKCSDGCHNYNPQNQSQEIDVTTSSSNKNKEEKIGRTPDTQTPPTKPNEDGNKYTECSVGKEDKTAGIFSTEDYLVLQMMQKAFSENGGVIAGTDLYKHKFTFTNVKRVLETNSQRLKKEVERVLNEYFAYATLPNSKELKKRLGI